MAQKIGNHRLMINCPNFVVHLIPLYNLTVYNSHGIGCYSESKDSNTFITGLAVGRKWRIVVIIAFIVGIISIIVGFVLPRLDSFPENILAGIAVSAFAFAMAVLLIEGPALTRERRLQEVIAIVSRSVAQINEEIALTLAREIGEYLADRLDSDGGDQGDLLLAGV
jgi:hypothetical protein